MRLGKRKVTKCKRRDKVVTLLVQTQSNRHKRIFRSLYRKDNE